ncbi:hypothetical protein RHGRI_018426 [Rhododendron griersonianum]|uniref:UBC core domain-containing protein n=2 Tax=Rhododendron griersonianum TaxID=479676 RepID=A0AAV6K1I2_9ERIC|nr:hypothetical protein RHGRI_018426 [Rhododendron griersonianum]
MEPQQLTRYIPQQSKKRVFPESSSSYMDQEVVEISPPSSWSSKPRLLKQKEIIQHEVIDIDMDEDSDDIMFIDEKIGANNKRKNDDKYAVLQAHFDTIDIPPGVEAPIPWFSNPTLNEKNSAAMKSSNCRTDSSHSWGLPELAKPGKTSASSSSSSLKTRMNTRSQPRWVPVPPSSSYAESAQNKKKSAASTSSTSGKSQMERAAANFPSRFKSIMEYSKKKLSLSGSNYASNSRLDAMQPPSGMESFQGPYLRSRRNKPVDNGDVIDAKFPAKDTMSLPPGVDPYMSGWQRYDGFMDKPSPMGGGIHNSSHSPFTSGEAFYAPWVQDFAYSQMSPTAAGKEFYGPWVQNLANSQMSPTAAGKESYAPWVQDLATSQESPTAAGKESYAPWVQDLATSQESPTAAGSSTVPPVATSPTESHGNDDDILKKFQLFKKFDMVQDHSDHYHSSKDTIFVRVYESRMDLLRAVIVGAEGTPYHDGLFFFDIFFPAGYPSVPPALILNEKPYFNEPGFAHSSGTPSGEKSSQSYNETTLILSLKTMVYTMKKPPKHFEDLVLGHFRKHAQDILAACKAYMEGVQVGCLAGGGVQDVDAGSKSCSTLFKSNLAKYITVLVQTFSLIGAKDCEKFLSLAKKGSPNLPHNYY